tara:strand:+ start:1289 stop:2053 length:765 start_codon:yes stop_codon:yes gene_type:complete
MFGLEGNGFLISITITLLLAGMITFYFRQQIGKVENKLTSMFQLIQSITSELNKINDILVKENNLEDNGSDNLPEPVCKPVSENASEYQETTTLEGESISQDNNLMCEVSPEPIKLPMNVDGPHIEIHAVRLNPLEMMVGKMNDEQDVKVVDLTTQNDDDESESELDTDTEDETVDLEVVNEDTGDENKIEIKVDKKGTDDEKEKPVQNEQSKTLTIVDYSKMHVAALREILVEKGLVTDAKKLRKKDMLELLG